MARKFIMKPSFITKVEYNRASSLTIDDDEEEIIDYGSERFFPYPSRGFRQQNHLLSGQTGSLTELKLDAECYRRKNDITCCSGVGKMQLKMAGKDWHIISGGVVNFSGVRS